MYRIRDPIRRLLVAGLPAQVGGDLIKCVHGQSFLARRVPVGLFPLGASVGGLCGTLNLKRDASSWPKCQVPPRPRCGPDQMPSSAVWWRMPIADPVRRSVRAYGSQACLGGRHPSSGFVRAV